MSRKGVIQKIVRRERNGNSLQESAVLEEDCGLHQDACELFGTWETALDYAGIRLPPPTAYSREELLREIRRRHDKMYSLASAHVKSRCPALYSAAIKYFQGWCGALEAVGIQPENVEPYPKGKSPNRHEVISEMLARNRRGLPMRRCHVLCDDYRLVRRARDLFGAWCRALEAAGLKPRT